MKTESAPGAKEMEEHNLDQASFRSLRPHSAKAKAEAHGRTKKNENEREAPATGFDYACA